MIQWRPLGSGTAYDFNRYQIIESYAGGAAIVIGVSGGAFRLEVSGASVAQLQAQTEFFA